MNKWMKMYSHVIISANMLKRKDNDQSINPFPLTPITCGMPPSDDVI